MSADDVQIVGRLNLDEATAIVYAHRSGYRSVRFRAGAVSTDVDLTAEQAAELVQALTAEVEW